jgi:hypothetical protein
MVRKIGVVLVLILALGAAAIVTGQEKGAEEITMQGGKQGKVPFPHHLHQKALQDCMACHALFPQEAGAVRALQSKGDLKKKQVMNQCTKCHRQKKKAGQKSGPTSCKKCHSA